MPDATLVLLHGGRLGAWSWRFVAAELRLHGMESIRIPFTGVGERAHLASPDTGLAVHAADVVGVLECDDLRDVTLVGHSYAGMIMPAVLARCPDRIRTAVYHDALLPRRGESVADVVGPEAWRAMKLLADARGDGWLMPVADDRLSQLGIGPGPRAEWAAARLTPHPLRCYTEPAAAGFDDWQGRKVFIRCTSGSTVPEAVAVRARQAGWDYREVHGSHNVMLSDPSVVAETLLTLAAGSRSLKG